MKLASTCFWSTVVCALLVGRACADPITLTFEGLQNFEAVTQYYNGGTGSLGSGPGPSYGITFDSNSLAYIPGQQTGHVTPYPGDPSPPTVLLLANNQYSGGYSVSTTMDVLGGFNQELDFYYINIASSGTSVAIYSGLDGTGTLLASMNLATTPQAFASGPTTISFTGRAYSVVFTGGNDQLVLDNISLFPGPAPVPEPSTMVLLASALPLLLIVGVG